MLLGQLQDKSQVILDRLIRTPDIADKIDRRLGIPNPYRPTGRVKLIILGQDPTVKRAASRQSITLSLNLDKPGALSAYLGKISNLVGLSLTRNVYATNLMKNFFVDPPATYSPECLSKLADYWFPLLKEDLSEFPGVPVIILGEPLLRMVLRDLKARVREYWAYAQSDRRANPMDFTHIEKGIFNRHLFPFPHQPSISKKFYRDNLKAYCHYARRFITGPNKP